MNALRSPLFRRLAVAWTFSNFGDRSSSVCFARASMIAH